MLQTVEQIQETPSCGFQAFFKRTRNEVEGIGLNIFDDNRGPLTSADGRPFNTFSDGQLRESST